VLRDRAAGPDPSGLSGAASLGSRRRHPTYQLITEGLIPAAAQLRSRGRSLRLSARSQVPGLLELTKFDLVSKVGAGTVETM
jgi:hypothetical protein